LESQTVAEFDSELYLLQAFKKQWRLFRQEARESRVRPMQLVLQWDPDLMADQHKKCRSFDVEFVLKQDCLLI